MTGFSSWAETKEDFRRQVVGLNFFPNVIAIDENILSKKSKTGDLCLLFIYGKNRKNADRLVVIFSKKVKKIKNIPVKTVVTDTPTKSDNPAGIFLAEWLDSAKFKQVLEFAISQKIIVFSAFVGDVERGATVGLNIGTKIRPSLNLTTLKKSQIKINKTFRRLSKHYE